MAWRDMTRWCGAALAVTTVAALTARPASAQDIERLLAGIRLNSKSSAVLAKFGNPNEVVIGDLGVRGIAPATGQAGQQGGFGGAQGGGFGGPGGGLPAPGGGDGPTMMGGRSGRGGFGGPPPGIGGPPPGFGGPPPGFGGPGGPGGPGFPPGDEIGFPGAPGAGAGAAGPTVGPFGQTQSNVARQQEVTWVYNRKVNNNLVTYEFLIGPSGQVIQIRVTGYRGGLARTRRGVVLGSTYKDVVRSYGYPEEHIVVGRTLVASYKNKAHVTFQFMNERGQANPMDDGNKVISITIATVE